MGGSSSSGTNVYEMQPRTVATSLGRERVGDLDSGAKSGPATFTRQRSSSSGALTGRPQNTSSGASGSGDVGRSASTSKRLTGGLKRTLGSLRRRHNAE